MNCFCFKGDDQIVHVSPKWTNKNASAIAELDRAMCAFTQHSAFDDAK
jgi:hypothetical protein